MQGSRAFATDERVQDGWPELLRVGNMLGMMTGVRLTAFALAATLIAGMTWIGSAAAQTPVTREACAAKLREAGRKFEEISSVMAAEADYADAHGGEFSPLMMQDFVSWYGREQARTGSNLPGLTETTLSPAQQASRQAAADRFARGRMDGYKAKMAALESDARQYCAGMKGAPGSKN